MRLLIVVLIMSFVGIMIWRSNRQATLGTYSNVPQELQINYVPQEFKLNMDEEKVLTILANPQRNRQAFNSLVRQVNLAILDHVGRRMDLTPSQLTQISNEYEKHHPYLRNLYYSDFLALKDTTDLAVQTWYESESSNSIDFLYEVASKYTCFLVNHIVSTVLPTEGGKIIAKGRNVITPCGLAITEALKPMMDRMKEQATVRDISRSRGLMQERMESVLAQLITYEVSDKKAVNKQLQTKIWGFSVSSTDIEISAISMVKIGFDLNKYFDVNADSRSKLVTVTLPQPEIISQDVYPRFEKLDIGWLREVESIDLNQSIDLLREEFRRDAMSPQVMESAKNQAANIIRTMFVPVVNSLNGSYKINVRFTDPPNNMQEDDFFKENQSTDE